MDKETILRSNISGCGVNNLDEFGDLNGVLNSMQEYSDQQTQLLTEQMQSLKDLNNELQDKLVEKDKLIEEISIECGIDKSNSLGKSLQIQDMRTTIDRLELSLTEKEKELSEVKDITDFINDINYMRKLYSNQKYSQAERERDKLAEKLDDIMRLTPTSN